jgi:hypothetical protein
MLAREFAHKFTISLEVEIVIHFYIFFCCTFFPPLALSHFILFYVPFGREHVTQKINELGIPKANISLTLSLTIRQFAVAFFVFFFSRKFLAIKLFALFVFFTKKNTRKSRVGETLFFALNKKFSACFELYFSLV